MRTLILLGASCLLLLACNDSSNGDTLIGASCDTSSMCGPAGVCITSGKDGECALPCQVPGGVGECPLHTYCDSENVTTDTHKQESDMTLCFPACTVDADCRDGYKCKGVSSGPGKICAPK